MITFPRLGLHGRLGNQLFQYALLVGISERTGYEVVIPEGPLRGFALAANRRPRERIRPERVRNERGASDEYDPTVFDCRDGTGFHGYFQSYRYFEHAESRIRSEFRFEEHVLDRAARHVERMRIFSEGRPLVAVHVRRGDYVNVPLHRASEVSHLTAAEAVLGVESPYFVVFSDDTSWCRAHLDARRYHVVDIPDPVEGLCVASQCQHFVSASSTFSWWAAWLGTTSADQRVLIPVPWFATRRSPKSRMSPLHWQRVVLDDSAFRNVATPGHPVAVLEGRHPHWTGEVCLWANGRMGRSGRGAGNWRLVSPRNLVLDWDDWPTETLRWNVDEGVFRDDSANFSLTPPLRFWSDVESRSPSGTHG